MEEFIEHFPMVIFANTYWESNLVKSMLEDAGIDAMLRDDSINDVVSSYDVDYISVVKVIVSSQDYDKAMEVLTEFVFE